MPDVFELLRSPRTSLDLHRALHSEWSLETIENLLLGLAKQKLVFSIESATDRNRVSDTASPWWPYFNLLSSSAKDWSTALDKINALQVTLVTRLRLPNDLLAQFKPDIISPKTFSESFPPQMGQANRSNDRLYVLVISALDTFTIEKLSRPALRGGARILPVLLDLCGSVVGPLLGGPGQPCLVCLSKRLQASSEKIEALLEFPVVESELFDNVEHAWPLTSWQKLGAILQDEIFKLESELTFSPLQRGAYLFDFFNQRSDYVDVFPIPGCDCSTGTLIFTGEL